MSKYGCSQLFRDSKRGAADAYGRPTIDVGAVAMARPADRKCRRFAHIMLKFVPRSDR